MSDSTRIWLAVSYAEPFRTGGWAFVRSDAAGLYGQAGGDRRISGERLSLAALLASLKERRGPVLLATSDAVVAGAPLRVAATGDEAPSDDLDLWAQVTTALNGHDVRILRQAPTPGGPLAFAVAWAEQARERAKNGPFAFAIPKPNLAKAGV